MLVTLTIPSTRLTREHTVCTHTGAPAPPPFHRAVGPSPIIYIVVARNAVCARLHHTINHTHDETRPYLYKTATTRLGLPSQGIRERPWQRDVEPWDDWSARVARVVGRGRRILLVPLQRPRAHDDRADGGAVAVAFFQLRGVRGLTACAKAARLVHLARKTKGLT